MAKGAERTGKILVSFGVAIEVSVVRNNTGHEMRTIKKLVSTDVHYVCCMARDILLFGFLDGHCYRQYHRDPRLHYGPNVLSCRWKHAWNVIYRDFSKTRYVSVFPLYLNQGFSSICQLFRTMWIISIIEQTPYIYVGDGNMAMSNTLGANILDILLCLGLPWTIKCLMTGREVEILSKALPFSILSIIGCIIVLYAVIAIFRFHLNKKVGFICLFLYTLFLVFAILFVLNIFNVTAWETVTHD